MWLNYHHLQYFWHVGREGSMAAASRSLHVGVPTISAQVKQLETALGQELFRRRGRRLELTDAGRVAFEFAEEIFARGQELLGALRGAGHPGETFRVGVSDALPKTVAWALLRPALEGEHPPRLVAQEGAPEDLLADLARHRLDVVLSDAPIPPGVDVRAFNHRLGESGTTFFAAPAGAQALRRRFPESLDGARLLMPGPRSALRRSVEHWLEDRALRPEIVGEFDDGALLKVAGAEGLGVFPAPSVARDEICRRHGVRVVGDAPDCVERFYAISVERRLQHPSTVAITEAARHDLFGDPGAGS